MVLAVERCPQAGDEPLAARIFALVASKRAGDVRRVGPESSLRSIREPKVRIVLKGGGVAEGHGVEADQRGRLHKKTSWSSNIAASASRNWHAGVWPNVTSSISYSSSLTGSNLARAGPQRSMEELGGAS